MKTENKDIFRPIPVVGILWAFIGLEIILIVFYALNFHGGIDEKQETWGQFGDFIGGIANPFLSSCSIVFFAYSINIQQKQNIEQSNLNKKEEEIRKEEISGLRKKQNTDDFLELISVLDKDIATLKSSVFINDITQIVDLHKKTYIFGTTAFDFTAIVYQTLCESFLNFIKENGNSMVTKYIRVKYSGQISLLIKQDLLLETPEIREFIDLRFS